MSITNSILDQVKSKELKDVLESSYLNNQQQADGEIRTMRNPNQAPKTVAEALMGQ